MLQRDPLSIKNILFKLLCILFLVLYTAVNRDAMADTTVMDAVTDLEDVIVGGGSDGVEINTGSIDLNNMTPEQRLEYLNDLEELKSQLPPASIVTQQLYYGVLLVVSPVAGVHYQTESQSGFTGNNGQFTFKQNETVTFSIGDIALGLVNMGQIAGGSTLITPKLLASNLSSNTETQLTIQSNLLRLLLTLDSDADPTNGIFISTLARQSAINTRLEIVRAETLFATDANLFSYLATAQSMAEEEVVLIDRQQAWDHYNQANTVVEDIEQNISVENASFLVASEDQPFLLPLSSGLFQNSLGTSLTYHVSSLPAWLSFNSSTLTLSGTPGNEDSSAMVGNINFTITASNEHGVHKSINYVLFVNNSNDAPTVTTPIMDQWVPLDGSYHFSFAAFSDVDAGDILRYQATLADGSPLPDWLQFDAASRTFTSHATIDNGYYSIRVTGQDQQNATASSLFTLFIGRRIGGRVVDENGRSLAGVTVTIHNQAWTKYATATTNSSGVYRALVEPGEYIAVIWGQQDRLPTWYPQVSNEHNAALIDVSSGNQENIHFLIRSGTRISGTIHGALSGSIMVTVWSEQTKTWGSQEVILQADGPNPFSIGGLREANDYILQWYSDQHVSGYYGGPGLGAVGRPQAKTLSTNNGNISAITIGLTTGKTLVVTCTGLSEGEKVDAKLWSNTLNRGGWAEAHANEQGIATLIIQGLDQEGRDFILFVHSTSGNHLSGNYQGSTTQTVDDALQDGDQSNTEAGILTSRAQATTISMEENLSVKITMQAGGRISGTIHGLPPGESAWIHAYSENTLGWGGTTVESDQEGNASYSLTGLKRAADYRVGISGETIHGGYYGGTSSTTMSTWQLAAPVDIVSDNVTGIDLSVAMSVSITGLIAGPTGPTGLDGLQPGETAFINAWSDSSRAFASTTVQADRDNPGGSVSYTLTGLASANDYQVSLSSDGYEEKQFQNIDASQRNASQGDTSQGDTSQGATGVDFVLSKGGSISGTISGLPPYQTVWLQAWSLLSQTNRGSSSLSNAAGQGSYRIDRLSHAEDYVVSLTLAEKTYFYHPDGVTPKRNQTATVSVQGTTTETIDLGPIK